MLPVRLSYLPTTDQVLMHQWLSDEKLRLLRNCGAPILVQVRAANAPGHAQAHVNARGQHARSAAAVWRASVPAGVCEEAVDRRGSA